MICWRNKQICLASKLCDIGHLGFRCGEVTEEGLYMLWNPSRLFEWRVHSFLLLSDKVGVILH